MEEIWKPVVWYEWLYEISNFGKVKSLRRQVLRKNKFYTWIDEIILRPFVNHWWYLLVQLCKDWQRQKHQIHRLVAIAFTDNIDNKPTVNHINWIRDDNRVENLEWMTISENVRDWFARWMIFVCPTKWRFWKDNKKSKPVRQSTKEWEFVRDWFALSDIWRELWIWRSNVGACCHWKIQSAYWYKRQYI